MASLFSARRKPKRVAKEDSQAEQDEDGSGPVVRRPGATKAKSKLRVSFNPAEADVEDSSALASENDVHVTKPLGRLDPSSALQDRLKQASLNEDDTSRPAYSKSYLDELRNSTPSTPADLSTTPDDDEQRILDIESKFGKLPSSTATHIPSNAEIAEKKARRARLALSGTADPHPQDQGAAGAAEDYIPLDAYDSDGEFKPQRMQVGTFLHQPEKTKDTRLEREDEDIAEGFESFIEDDPSAIRGRYTTSSLQLDRKSQRAHKQRTREEMRTLIDRAEGSSSESSASGSDQSDSEVERRHAYETAQTHHGLDGLSSHTQQKIIERRPKQPKETTTIPKLSVGLAGLKGQVDRIEAEKERMKKRLEDVRREKGEVRKRALHVQGELDKLGKEVEDLRRRKGESSTAPNGNGGSGSSDVNRGLETYGARDGDEDMT